MKTLKKELEEKSVNVVKHETTSKRQEILLTAHGGTSLHFAHFLLQLTNVEEQKEQSGRIGGVYSSQVLQRSKET